METSQSSMPAVASGAHTSAAAPAADTVVTPDVVPALELGFSVVILGIGLIGGLLFSKIVNWWKW